MVHVLENEAVLRASNKQTLQCGARPVPYKCNLINCALGEASDCGAEVPGSRPHEQ